MNLLLLALSLHGPGGKALDDFSVAQQKQDDGRNKRRNNPRRFWLFYGLIQNRSLPIDKPEDSQLNP